MSAPRAFGSLRFGRAATEKQVDLGGGRTARPEDLLEGHFQRLSQRNAGIQEVNVQVGPDLSTVIHASAPTLAPLAVIAEEVASRMPTVQPDVAFRSSLQRSLEEAHLRQMAARYGPQRPQSSGQRSPWMWMGLGALAIAAAGLWLVAQNRRAA